MTKLHTPIRTTVANFPQERAAIHSAVVEEQFQADLFIFSSRS